MNALRKYLTRNWMESSRTENLESLKYYEILGVNVKFISASIYILRNRNIICLFFQIKYYNLFYKMKNCILFLNWFQVLRRLLYTGYNLVITSILSSSEKMNWIKISCFQRKRKMDWRYLSKYKWRHNSSVKSAALSSSRYINSFLLFLVS